MTFLIDTHCHLTFDALSKNQVLDEVIKRAHAVGVQKMITVATKLEQYKTIQNIIEKYPSVYGSCGVHPHECHLYKKDIMKNLEEILIQHTGHKKIVALGETGLDFSRNEDALQKSVQMESFLCHIEAAEHTHLPIIIHARQADEAIEHVLKDIAKQKNITGVMHCFTSERRLAQIAIDCGFFISISGILTFKNATMLRDIVSYVPLDCLLIETDAPYLAPHPFRGKVNEPSFLIHTYKTIVSIKSSKKETEKNIMSALTLNAQKLFSLTPTMNKQ